MLPTAPSDSLELAKSAAFAAAEGSVDAVVQWLRLAVELLGATIIGIGVLTGLWQFARASSRRMPGGYNDIRLSLARYLAVALEFQLAADLLSTAIAPSWDAIGKLAAIAAVRTALNFFLGREISEVRAGATEGSAANQGPLAPGGPR